MVEIVASIKPKWIRKILRKEKAAEIRKNFPHCGGSPFKIYIYETKQGRGAVVGECICYMVDWVYNFMDVTRVETASCLNGRELSEYANGRDIYAWFLAHVVEYEKPRPLSYFGLKRAPQSWAYVRRNSE